MPKYIVLVPINHNQEDYLPSAEIELDDNQAEPLLKVKAIKDIEPEQSATTSPDAPADPAPAPAAPADPASAPAAPAKVQAKPKAGKAK